jgi:hypothetical protein
MWTYEQSTGKLYHFNELVGMGYSGHLDGKNNPAAQNEPDTGPLPEGTYTIGPSFDSPTHGPVAMRLTPDPENQMFGRAGFLMHGDSIIHPGMASLGCIIQMRAVREAVSASMDKSLVVVAAIAAARGQA